MIKTLVLLTVLLSLTISTARVLDENVSVMVFNRDFFSGFKDDSGSGVRQRKQGIQCFHLQYNCLANLFSSFVL